MLCEQDVDDLVRRLHTSNQYHESAKECFALSQWYQGVPEEYKAQVLLPQDGAPQLGPEDHDGKRDWSEQALRTKPPVALVKLLEVL